MNAMKIDIVTIFPAMFSSPFSESIIKRAIDNQIVNINLHNLRNWTADDHKTVDGRPYGGGPGMVMMIEPIDKAVKDLKTKNSHIILTSAKGTTYNQQTAQKYSQHQHLIIITGHYEGIDQRVADHLVDEVISIGDYVLTGGELPAMVIVDSVVRLLPGVVGDSESLEEESHNQPGYIEYPQYTRPENYQGWQVPKVLTSGDHSKVHKWRQEKSNKKTL